MLPTPSELPFIDHRINHLLNHIRKHLQRNGIRDATKQTIALNARSRWDVSNWFEPLLKNADVRTSIVKGTNRVMYATGWQINEATVKKITAAGSWSKYEHLHLAMDFDPERMTHGARDRHEEEDRQAAISELEGEMAALLAKMEALRAA